MLFYRLDLRCYIVVELKTTVGVSSFELDKYIPKEVLEKLLTEEDINLHIDLE